MNNDLISREALLQRIGEKLNVLRSCNDFKEAWGMKYAMVMIQNAPAVDAVEVVHGKWIEKEGLFCETFYRCSACEEDIVLLDGEPMDNWYNYCPNCGARMDGE